MYEQEGPFEEEAEVLLGEGFADEGGGLGACLSVVAIGGAVAEGREVIG